MAAEGWVLTHIWEDDPEPLRNERHEKDCRRHDGVELVHDRHRVHSLPMALATVLLMGVGCDTAAVGFSSPACVLWRLIIVGNRWGKEVNSGLSEVAARIMLTAPASQCEKDKDGIKEHRCPVE